MDDIMEHFGFKLRKGFADAIATQVLPQQSPRQPSPEDVAAQKIFKFLERKAGTMSEEDELEICVLVNQANLSAKNPSGNTLLNLAVWNKHDKVFMALLDKGADPLALDINKANAFGAAILCSNHGCLDVLLKRGGVDPNCMSVTRLRWRNWRRSMPIRLWEKFYLWHHRRISSSREMH